MNVALILSITALSLNAAELKHLAAGDNPMVAHEWGTFTSVAAEDGHAVPWAPLRGAPDLPCFVARSGQAVKWEIGGLVRMETPVLYFYSQRPLTLDVHVGFPLGVMTEWYPQASRIGTGDGGPVYRNGSIEWNGVNLLPGTDLEFPSSKGASRYYAARNTDAVPLRIGSQQEKMIFYRGVGSFPPPVHPRYAVDGKLVIQNAGAETIPLAILFENHGGKIGYRVVRGIEDSVTLDTPPLTAGFEQLRAELTRDLTGFGLYAKEAAAMVETWRDSWFEEGTRILYIMPRKAVDSVLPLHVTPAPAETARVFVGRVEVLSPTTKQTIEDAAGRGDSATLARFGRFLLPFAAQLKLGGAAIRAAIAAGDRSSQLACIQ